MDIIKFSREYLDKIIDPALKEDAGRGDITSEILVPCDLQGRAYMLAQGQGGYCRHKHS